jgi:hypothetical protein
MSSTGGLAKLTGAALADSSSGSPRMTLSARPRWWRCASLMFGPWIIVPVAVLANTAAFVASTDQRRRGLVIGMGALAVTLPFILERCGILPQSIVFRDGAMVLLPVATWLPSSVAFATRSWRPSDGSTCTPGSSGQIVPEASRPGVS